MRRFLSLTVLIAGLLYVSHASLADQSVVIGCGTPSTAVACGTTANPLVTTPSTTGTENVNIQQVGGATTATGHGPAAGTLRVELPTDGTGIVGLAAGSNTIGSLTANQSVNVTQFSGTAAVNGSGTSAGALRVELPTNGTGVVGLNAGSALIGNVGLGQASTTSGQSGPLVQCAVTTSAPTYTTAQTDPLSCDTAGNLRVGGGLAQSLATSGQLGSLVMGAVTTAAPTYVTGNTNPLSLDVNGNLRVISEATAAGAASYTHVAAGQATTTVKSGAGTLYALVLNSAASATNTTTLYDNTAGSGTVIAIPAATTATLPITMSYGPVGIAFATGLTVVTATANGSDMTFVYK